VANYTVREIEPRDLSNVFLEALSNLSDVRGMKPAQLARILNGIRENPFHKVFVAVRRDGEVLGTTTILVEPKFAHNGGFVGHIEDVAVRGDMVQKGIGKTLVEKAVAYARHKGCYKCILACNDSVVGFYEKIGFRDYGHEMRMDLVEQSPSKAKRAR
jgi:glucosamine-phosphate N-acetyltransferase